MDLFNRTAEYIIDSPDCKKEIIWLLKKHFKNTDNLLKSYPDVLYNPIRDNEGSSLND